VDEDRIGCHVFEVWPGSEQHATVVSCIDCLGGSSWSVAGGCSRSCSMGREKRASWASGGNWCGSSYIVWTA